jgi:CheY-like chemotaxis protein
MQRRILIIDSEPATVQQATEALEGAGYEVISAGDCEEGLRMIHADHPHLLFLSDEPSAINAFDLMRVLHRNPETRDFPFFFLTNPKMAEDMLSSVICVGPRPDAVLVRPLDTAQLVEYAQKLFEILDEEENRQ